MNADGAAYLKLGNLGLKHAGRNFLNEIHFIFLLNNFRHSCSKFFALPNNAISRGLSALVSLNGIKPTDKDTVKSNAKV